MKIICLSLLASALYSLPQGAEVQHGTVHFEQGDQALNLSLLQDRTVVQWDSFSIGESETVRIEMPNALSGMLNRVVGGNISEIHGKLLSNGQVWLINPAGILIGQNALVETGGFLASTFDVLNKDFLDGCLKFTGEAGKIHHMGTIKSPYGKVHLLAKEIEVDGSIEAEQIETAYFFTKNESLIAFDPDTKADHPYAHAIRMSGKIDGKEIHLFADTINVEGSLHAPAGEILIGGDYQGKNSSAPHAKRTVVTETATLNVSGEEDAGKVVIWSDGFTHFSGHINARGGEFKGNGGLVEVSGNLLDFVGTADRRASHGKAGMLLLDPLDITISSGSNNNVTGMSPFTPTGTASVLNVTTLVTALESGNVTVQTTGTVGAANGGITVNANIAPTMGTNNLTLDATGPVLINSFIDTHGDITITTSGTGQVSQYNGVTVNAAISTDMGSVSITGTGWNPVMIGMPMTTHGVVISAQIDVSAGPGNITITGTAAENETFQSSGVIITDGNLVTAGGNIQVTGTVPMGATGNFDRGVYLFSGGITTNSGNVTISGTCLSSSSDETGVRFATATITTASGDVSVTGVVQNAVPAGASYGVFFNPNPISTTSGDITISGTVGSTDSACYGVSLTQPWTTGPMGGTTGALIFANCSGGSGGAGHAVAVAAPLVTGGALTATTGIVGGSGAGSIGFWVGDLGSFGGGSISAQGAIAITASTNGSGTGSHGISIEQNSVTTVGTSTITLNGSSSPTSTGTSHGINLAGGALSTGSGAISLTGNVPTGATGSSVGILIGTTDGVTTTGTITLDGSSSATGASSHGVSVTSPWTTGTAALFTFSGCSGGSGPTSHGVNIGAAFSTGGAITATSGIVGGSGAGSNGFRQGAAFGTSGASAIAITATTTGSGAGSHGISLTSGALSSTGAGTITLNGTSSSFSTGPSHGINISGGTITTGSGSISLTGVVPMSGAGVSVGILMGTTNGVQTSGAITLSGTNLSAGALRHGIATTADWSTLSTGLVQFTGVSNGSSFRVAFGGNVTTLGNLTVNSNAGVTAASIFSVAGNLTFSGTINGVSAGVGALTLSPSGDLTLSDDIGGTTRIGAFSITDGTIVAIPSAITASSIAISPAVALAGPLTLSNEGGSGNISFSNEITGAQTLTITAGTGTITFSGAVGTSMTPLSSLVIHSSGGVTASGAIFAGLINQDIAATGVSTYSGALTTNAGGITLAGTTFSFGGAITATGGAVSVSNSGTATMAGAADVTTTNQDITFTGPIAMTGNITMGSAGGDITLGGVVTGSFTLDLTAGAGTIELTGGAGSEMAPITSLLIHSSGGVSTTGDIFAGFITQDAAATGASTYNGGLTASGATGITLTGTSFTFEGNVSSGGPFSITNTGTATFGSTFVITDAFTQTGGGNVNLGGDITAASISFNDLIVLVAASSLTANDTSVDIPSTIDGTYSLQLAAQTEINLNGEVGGTTPLASLTTGFSGETHVFADITANGSTLQFNNPVILESDPITITDLGSGITFNDTVDGPSNLTLNAPNGSIIAQGTITDLTTLTSSSGEESTYFDLIEASGTVSIESTDSFVLVSQITTSGGDITLAPSGDTTPGPSGSISPIGYIYMYGDLTAPMGTVTLGPTVPRTALMNIATIAGFPESGTFTITANALTIGDYEAFTVFGSLNIAVMGAASFGEIVTTNSLTINSGSNTIFLHEPGLIYDAYRRIYTDSTTNILATAAIPTINPAPTFSGPGTPVNLLQVALTPEQFQSRLLINNGGEDILFLTYDPTTVPAPPSPASSVNVAEAIYDMQIAVSELNTYRLPIWSDYYQAIYEKRFLVTSPKSAGGQP